MKAAIRTGACLAALMLGSLSGSACNVLAECDGIEAMPFASFDVSDAEGDLARFAGAEVETGYSVSIEFEDEAGDLWRVRYQVANAY